MMCYYLNVHFQGQRVKIVLSVSPFARNKSGTDWRIVLNITVEFDFAELLYFRFNLNWNNWRLLRSIAICSSCTNLQRYPQIFIGAKNACKMTSTEQWTQFLCRAYRSCSSSCHVKSVNRAWRSSRRQFTQIRDQISPFDSGAAFYRRCLQPQRTLGI